MFRKASVLMLAIVVGLVLPGSAQAIDVVSSDAAGGPTPEDLATIALEETCNLSLVTDSAHIKIQDVDSGEVDGEPKTMGSFTNGKTAPGTLLPVVNQNIDGDAAYAGGIGIEEGICLGTGLITDNDPTPDPVEDGRGYGVEGPNNGEGNNGEGGIWPGEATWQWSYRDQDFEAATSLSRGNDPAVLEFEVQVNKTGYLRSGFVFASDENPAWITLDFNDSFVILVKPASAARPEFKNFILLRDPNPPPGEPNVRPFDIDQIKTCGAPVFKENQIAPNPSTLNDSPHTIPGSVPYYDHEYGGFTSSIQRETEKPLTPGTYTIKIVIADVLDRQVDAALFIPKDGIKLFTVLQADFDMDGDVDGDDFLIWQSGFGTGSGATKLDGDADLDGDVDGDDFLIWQGEFGNVGNPDARADFNRDGYVDGNDFNIFYPNYQLPMDRCASRFEGDADNDGAVTAADFAIYVAEFGASTQDPGCGAKSGGGGASSASAGQPNSYTFSADYTGDGVIDAADVAVITAKVNELQVDGAHATEDVNGDGQFDAADLRAWQDGTARSSETSLAGLAIGAAVDYYSQLFGIGAE